MFREHLVSSLTVLERLMENSAVGVDLILELLSIS